MIFKTLKLTLILGFILGLAYILQIKFFQTTISNHEANLIKFSYLFNFAFTYFLMLNIIIFENKLRDKLGFIYLGISMLKFGIFFFLIKIKNIEINKSDFLLFFIPFVLCLGVEIFYVVRILNSINYNSDKELE